MSVMVNMVYFVCLSFPSSFSSWSAAQPFYHALGSGDELTVHPDHSIYRAVKRRGWSHFCTRSCTAHTHRIELATLYGVKHHQRLVFYAVAFVPSALVERNCLDGPDPKLCGNPLVFKIRLGIFYQRC